MNRKIVVENCFYILIFGYNVIYFYLTYLSIYFIFKIVALLKLKCYRRFSSNFNNYYFIIVNILNISAEVIQDPSFFVTLNNII